MPHLVSPSTGSPLSPAALLQFALAFSRELAELHALDQVHGELCPSLILWDGEEELRILPPRSSGTRAGQEALCYGSPEQARGDPPTQRSDVFAAGVLLHELATGVHPFWDETTWLQDVSDLEDLYADLTYRPAEPLARLRPDLWLDWDALLSICLALEPKERFASALDLEKQIQKLAREGGRARIRFRPHWPRIALAVILLGLVILALYLGLA